MFPMLKSMHIMMIAQETTPSILRKIIIIIIIIKICRRGAWGPFSHFFPGALGAQQNKYKWCGQLIYQKSKASFLPSYVYKRSLTSRPASFSPPPSGVIMIIFLWSKHADVGYQMLCFALLCFALHTHIDLNDSDVARNGVDASKWLTEQVAQAPSLRRICAETFFSFRWRGPGHSSGLPINPSVSVCMQTNRLRTFSLSSDPILQPYYISCTWSCRLSNDTAHLSTDCREYITVSTLLLASLGKGPK